MNNLPIIATKYYGKHSTVDKDILKHSNSIIYVNAVSYQLLKDSNTSLDEFDVILTDGILLVRLLKIIGIKDAIRATFDMTSIANDVFEHAQLNRMSIYFIGAKQDEIEAFVRLIKINYPSLKIAGYRDGFFDIKDQSIYQNIVDNNPDIVIAGMGTPRQEIFLDKLKMYDTKFRGILISCGGFFHQTQENLEYYPFWINKMNLRMPYRLFKEKLFNRLYLYPKFLISFLFDYITYQFHNK